MMRATSNKQPATVIELDRAGAFLAVVVESFETALLELHARTRGDERHERLAQRLEALQRNRAALEERDRSLPIHALRQRFQLTWFEEQVLLLAACAQLDPTIGAMLADEPRPDASPHVTAALCLRLFGGSRRQRMEAIRAFDASSTLLSSGLVRVVHAAPAATRLQQAIVAPGYLVGFLRGRRELSPSLASVARIVEPEVDLDAVALPDDERRRLSGLADMFVAYESTRSGAAGPGIYDAAAGSAILLSGPRGVGKTLTARAMAGRVRRRVIEVDGRRLSSVAPATAAEALDLLCREAAFTGDWLLLDDFEETLGERTHGQGTARLSAAGSVLITALQRWPITAVITATDTDSIPPALSTRLLAHRELRSLTREQRNFAWQLNLPEAVVVSEAVDFERLAERHPLSGRGIQTAIALASRGLRDAELGPESVESAAQAHEAHGLGGYAQRTQVYRQLADLIVDDEVATQVAEIIAIEQIRDRALHDTGLDAQLQTGLGLSCLLEGPPGTGKTLAAEVIASELGLPLYTVNIANVVSRWMGETEKNLQAIFDCARKHRCVLLFDEADALFAKRTEVRHSNDRNANMEVGLLLQLVERHRGLVLLTTNMKDNIDPAFARRFAFKIRFDVPDVPTRARIWQRLLPVGRLAEDVDAQELASRFEFAGGSIRSIVLRATYRAAIAAAPITMQNLCSVAVLECKALGRLVRADVDAQQE